MLLLLLLLLLRCRRGRALPPTRDRARAGRQVALLLRLLPLLLLLLPGAGRLLLLLGRRGRACVFEELKEEKRERVSVVGFSFLDRCLPLLFFFLSSLPLFLSLRSLLPASPPRFDSLVARRSPEEGAGAA